MGVLPPVALATPVPNRDLDLSSSVLSATGGRLTLIIDATPDIHESSYGSVTPCSAPRPIASSPPPSAE
eukprot:14956691-Alexandrium_andersonii.AAC.1